MAGLVWHPSHHVVIGSRIPGGAATEFESFSMAKGANQIVKDNLGREIRRLRLSLNMSQTQLAEKAETDQAFISDLERGIANPTLDSLLRIAKALRVNVAELFHLRHH
jgi:DNA-binding XRE family transcriptional regulator